jgi:dissimilatory sulfite reductase related protein
MDDTKGFEFDEDGFLLDPNTWNAELARELARADGIGELGDEHWKVLEELRKHYLRSGAIPAMQHVCKTNHLDPKCVHDLFHTTREAWRVAGLPNPGEEAKSYMY